MEVHVIPPAPAPAVDFHYDSASTSPYATAPSSPQSTIPFTWEEKPGIPKQNTGENEEENDTDFAFGFLERHSISAADELFDCGKIKPLKPLKPPPRLHSCNDHHSPKSPRSPKLGFIDALKQTSPRSKKKEFDPFSEALKQTSCVQTQWSQLEENRPHRGRERSLKTNRYKVSRSMSPLRVSDIVNNRKPTKDQSSPAGLTWYNKWNFKNLLLFRSASEGSAISKKNQSFSFRSTDGGESMKLSGEDRSNKSAGLMRCLRFHQNAGSVGMNSVMKR